MALTMDGFLKKVLGDQEYRLIPLIEEGSERRYTRVLIKKQTDSFSLTQQTSWILASSPVQQAKHFIWRQADFLKAGLNVPQLYPSDLAHLEPSQAGLSASQKSFLLIEDLGEQSLEKQVLESPAFPVKDYFKALDQLLQLQKKQALLFQTGLTPTPWKKEDFLKEMLWTEQYLIQKLLKYQLEGKERESVFKEWHTIAQKLSHFPFQSGHRDFHSRNLFIKEENIYMIDFQDAGFFPRFYDVVSLIYDVYVDHFMDHLVRDKLLAYFISQSSILESPKAIKQEIALTAGQRLFQAVGRFASFYMLKNQTTHLKHIYPGLKRQEELLKTQLLTKNNSVSYPYFLNLIQKLTQMSKTISEIQP